jgi:hypothetical protein
MIALGRADDATRAPDRDLDGVGPGWRAIC